MLPILHLNGWKIANPTVLARIGDDELDALLTGYGHQPDLRDRRRPRLVHQELAAAMDDAYADIRRFQSDARDGGSRSDRAGLRSSCERRRAGPDRRSSTESRSRARGVLIRCLSPERGRTRSTSHSSSMAEELSPRGAVRRGRAAGRAGPCGRSVRGAPHGLEPARERGRAAAGSSAAGLPRFRSRRAESRAAPSARRRACSGATCAR